MLLLARRGWGMVMVVRWDEVELSCLGFLGCDDKILTQVLENGNGIERCRMTENLVGNKCSMLVRSKQST